MGLVLRILCRPNLDAICSLGLGLGLGLVLGLGLPCLLSVPYQVQFALSRSHA